MRKVLTVTILAGLLALITAAPFAADKPQANCPVSGHAVDKKVYVDYQGQRVYFCCDKCPAKFKADPEKYFAQFVKEGIVLENVQVTCPVSGEDIDKKAFTDYKGRRVYFCCSKCIAKFQKDPEAFLKKLPGQKEPSK